MAKISNFDKTRKELLKKYANGINKALPFIVNKAKENTPEDTKKLLNSYQIIPARDEGDRIVGKVRNNAEYAFYVEYGTKRAKNYHKPKGIKFFESGDYKGLSGARMLTRAVDENSSEIIQIINKG